MKQKLKQKVTRNKSTVKKVLATALKSKTKKKEEKKEPTIQVINLANQGGGSSSSSSSGVNNQPAAAPKAKAAPVNKFAAMRAVQKVQNEANKLQTALAKKKAQSA